MTHNKQLKLKRMSWLITLLLALAACGGTTAEPAAQPATAEPIATPTAEPVVEPTAEPPMIQPNEGDIVLAIGRPALLADGTQIALLRVADSRCPQDVTCVWAGEFTADLEITAADGRTESVSLGTLQPAIAALLNGDELLVKTAEPYPISTATILPEGYEVTLSRTPAPVKGEVGTAAYVGTLDVLLMESFPLQASAHVQGNLPDGCTTITAATAERVDNQFTITLTTNRPADMMCTMALVPFEQNVPLDILGLPAGTYTVVAGEATAEFTLDMDNILPAETAEP